jgi:uncharacterized protein (TIGR02145 family)
MKKKCNIWIYVSILIVISCILSGSCKKEKEIERGNVTDIDGNVYQTVKISNQWWMAENLKTTRYSDGTPIPFVNSRNLWAALTTTDKAYCYYDDNPANAETYGALYTWAAAMKGVASSISDPSRVQGACPTGWHLPSHDEWQSLETYLGGSSVAGGKLKEAGTTHWLSPNVGATNESGFSAVPGGFLISFPNYPSSYCAFVGNGSIGVWWSSSEDLSTTIYRSVSYDNSSVEAGGNPKIYGQSVRCVKDNENITSVQIPTVNTSTIKDITDITVYCDGAITSDGGSVITKCGFIWSTDSTNLNFGTNNFSSDSLVNGTFNRTITHLSSGTKYYAKAYATNKIGAGYGKTMAFTTKVFISNINFNPSIDYGNLVDQDGNTYKTVKIGNQTWMAENLKAITYNDGKPIKDNYNNSYVYWYNDDPLTNKANYGALYAAYAIYNSSKKLCPSGWHVPTSDEWDTLIIYLGGNSIAGGKMKETGTTHWNDPNNGATNESGFTLLPGGYYGSPGWVLSYQMGSLGCYFSSTMKMTRQAGVDILAGTYYQLKFNSEEARKVLGNLISTASVRCVKN